MCSFFCTLYLTYLKVLVLLRLSFGPFEIEVSLVSIYDYFIDNLKLEMAYVFVLNSEEHNLSKFQPPFWACPIHVHFKI